MTNEAFLVLSALGPDRAGLAAEVIEYLTERGARVKDSHMVVIGAEFGILVLVSGTLERIAAVEKDATALAERIGLGVTVRRTKSPEQHQHSGVIHCLVTAEAIDQERIALAVARALNKVSVNIVSLETTAYEAPLTGSPLLRLEARIDVSRAMGIGMVRRAMDEVAESENVDIDVQALIARSGGGELGLHQGSVVRVGAPWAAEISSAPVALLPRERRPGSLRQCGA